jgi:hypothetical protein
VNLWGIGVKNQESNLARFTIEIGIVSIMEEQIGLAEGAAHKLEFIIGVIDNFGPDEDNFHWGRLGEVSQGREFSPSVQSFFIIGAIDKII